ncbi:hypothetical protein [Acanthopleuribacter pedis]|uniref:Ig-like domain-containing protein n=1 Tax=Acanthopleuribacter pedis TaxID=442870 RepID=A0A8J7U6H9_9BACT|nr:hypothetical protein [Acanthopleuribacter pedis]MBO1321944.1 hypothetical protein [Acanthopleuribacter pedis]
MKFTPTLVLFLLTATLFAAPTARILAPIDYRDLAVGDSLLLRGEVTDSNNEGSWLIQKLGDEDAPPVTLPGNLPGRYRFQEQGLYQVTFQVNDNGALSPRDVANSRLIGVAAEDLNFEPTLEYTGQRRLTVANGSEREFTVVSDDFENSFPEDYPGNQVFVYWFVDGTLAATGESFSLPLEFSADQFRRGVRKVNLDVYAADSEGKASLDRHRIEVFVYQDAAPPVPGFNGTEPNETVYLPVGTRTTLVPSLGNAGNTAWTHAWRAVHLQSGEVLMESSEAQPPALNFTETGVVKVSYDVAAVDRGAVEPHTVWYYIYDPDARPTVKITEPSTDALRFEAGGAINITNETGIRLKGFVYDPNRFFPTEPGQNFRPVAAGIRWQFILPGGSTFTLDGVTQNASWVLDEIGTWQLSMSAVNSLGQESLNVDRMEIEVAAAGTLNEAEPNNTREQATDTRFGSFAGLSLSAEDPVDWFAFDLEEAGENLLINLDLRRAEGRVQVEVFQGERSVHTETLAGGLFHPFSFVSADPGRYFLKASLVDADSAGKNGLSFGLAVSVAVPRLSFPKIREDATHTSELSLVNPTNGPARLSLEARNPNGEILQIIALDLDAKGRLRRGVTELFPAAEPYDIAWVRVLADRAVTGSFSILSRDGRSAAAEPAQSGLLHELVMPHVAADTATWFTEVALVNNSTDTIEPHLNTPSNAFTLDVDRPYRGDTLNFNDLYAGNIPASDGWGLFSEQNNLPALAGVELFGFHDATQTAALNLASTRAKNPNFIYTRNDLVFPHVAADTVQFWTGLAYVNTDDSPTDIRLKAYDTAGNLLTEESATLAAGEKRLGLAHQLFDSLDVSAPIGWIKLETTGQVQGYELFGSNRPDRRRLAGLAAVAGGAKAVTFPDILSNAEAWTGLAVVNLAESATATLTYTAHAADGTVLATREQILAPRAKQTTLVATLFGSETAQSIAWISLNSDQPLASFQLRGDLAGHTMTGMTAR